LPAVTRRAPGQQHRHEERPDLRPAESELERPQRHEVAREHQHRRDEERDLDAAPERDADGEVHLVPARHRDRRARVGRAADDRNSTSMPSTWSRESLSPSGGQ